MQEVEIDSVQTIMEIATTVNLVDIVVHHHLNNIWILPIQTCQYVVMVLNLQSEVLLVVLFHSTAVLFRTINLAAVLPLVPFKMQMIQYKENYFWVHLKH